MGDVRIVSTRVEPGEPPAVLGSIKRPCMADPKHSVWIGPTSQKLLGTARVICLPCLADELGELDDG